MNHFDPSPKNNPVSQAGQTPKSPNRTPEVEKLELKTLFSKLNDGTMTSEELKSQVRNFIKNHLPPEPVSRGVPAPDITLNGLSIDFTFKFKGQEFRGSLTKDGTLEALKLPSQDSIMVVKYGDRVLSKDGKSSVPNIDYFVGNLKGESTVISRYSDDLKFGGQFVGFVPTTNELGEIQFDKDTGALNGKTASTAKDLAEGAVFVITPDGQTLAGPQSIKWFSDKFKYQSKMFNMLKEFFAVIEH
jgi:hypothetical protein